MAARFALSDETGWDANESDGVQAQLNEVAGQRRSQRKALVLLHYDCIVLHQLELFAAAIEFDLAVQQQKKVQRGVCAHALPRRQSHPLHCLSIAPTPGHDIKVGYRPAEQAAIHRALASKRQGKAFARQAERVLLIEAQFKPLTLQNEKLAVDTFESGKSAARCDVGHADAVVEVIERCRNGFDQKLPCAAPSVFP